MKSQPLDIRADIWDIHTQYCKQAVGPAAGEVLKKGHRELSQLGNLLKRIPGQPSEVEVIGEGPDRVKLSWLPPEKNPEAVESYVVWKQEKGKQWERVRETKKTKILITGLKSNTQYQFNVAATNDLIKSVATKQYSCTMDSRAEKGIAGSIEGSMASLFPITFWNDDKTTHIVLTLATLACPLSIVCAPVTVPVAAVWFATKRVKEGCYSGDLSPESDDCTS